MLTGALGFRETGAASFRRVKGKETEALGHGLRLLLFRALGFGIMMLGIRILGWGGRQGFGVEG